MVLIKVILLIEKKKKHGDKGVYVGSDLTNKKVLSVDDVLTSGKTTVETKKFIDKNGGQLVASLVALNRGEQYFNNSNCSAEVGLKINIILTYYL